MRLPHPIEPRRDHNRGRGHLHLLVAILAALLALLLVVLLPRAAAAGKARSDLIGEGRQEYEENCTGCHGGDGKGGPLAAKLVKPPKDLTAIAERNGGTFPFWRMLEIIAGETPVEGHDTHQMPDFSASLEGQDRKPGYLPASVRVLLLTHYLESLQKGTAR